MGKFWPVIDSREKALSVVKGAGFLMFLFGFLAAFSSAVKFLLMLEALDIVGGGISIAQFVMSVALQIIGLKLHKESANFLVWGCLLSVAVLTAFSLLPFRPNSAMQPEFLAILAGMILPCINAFRGAHWLRNHPAC